MASIYEYRGVKGLVAAEVLVDDNLTGEGHGYIAGPVFPIAGVSELTKQVEQSMNTHYYDNYGAVVVDSLPTDSLSINTSAIPADVYAKLTGATYDNTTGMLIEGKYTPKYFAVGYVTEDTNGNEYYVWHLKGRFTVGGITHTTKNDSTDASGQTLTYNGVRTQTEFTKGGSGATSIEVNAGLGLVNVANFFSSVQTPDTVLPKVSYTLSLTQAASTVLTVKRGDEVLADEATIYAGDELKVTVTGGTVTVNSDNFFSGDIHVVTGNTTVVSTASA